MTEFDKDYQRRVGERGNAIFERTKETTDIDEMQEKTVETTGTCYCGRPIMDREQVRRCVSCDLLVCQSCQVVVRRQIICQTCAEQGYGLDKETFLTLYLLDKDLVAADQLVEVATAADGTPIEVRIDVAARPLFERGYIDEDGSVSLQGKEAIQVGRQLFESEDVTQVIRDAEIRRVADR